MLLSPTLLLSLPGRFEALCTSQAVADPSSEFGVLLRTRLAAHRVLLGAEVDCYDPQHAQQAQQEAQQAGQPGALPLEHVSQERQEGPWLDSFLELKTYRLPSHPRQQRTIYQHKHPKWWLQARVRARAEAGRALQEAAASAQCQLSPAPPLELTGHTQICHLQSFLAGVPRLALGARDDQVRAPQGMQTGIRACCAQGTRGQRLKISLP